MNRSGLISCFAAVTALVCGTLADSPAYAAPRVQFTRHTVVEITFRPISAPPVEGTEDGAFAVVARPREPGSTKFTLQWPDAETPTAVSLRATQSDAPDEFEASVLLEAELTLRDGRKVRSSRTVLVNGRTTSLFEVFRLGELPLTLVVEAEAEVETVVSRRATVGAPVRFLVEIQRVDAGRSISLETDFLQTFIGESVSYAFNLGQDSETHAIRFALTPRRITGNLVEVDVETSGRLPGEEGPLLLGRREQLIASRGAVSTLSFESGEPPTGYRFLVTAEF